MQIDICSVSTAGDVLVLYVIPNVYTHPDASGEVAHLNNLYMQCYPAVTTRRYLDIDVGGAAIVSAREKCVECSQAGAVGQCQTPQESQVVCFACVLAVVRSSACREYTHLVWIARWSRLACSKI